MVGSELVGFINSDTIGIKTDSGSIKMKLKLCSQIFKYDFNSDGDQYIIYKIR